jgi:FKBP-type peptidyl-prolyl cis-trans isomerase FkpA
MMHSRSIRAAVLAAASIAFIACAGVTEPSPSDPAKETYAASLGVDLSKMTKLYDDLYIQDITIGTGSTIATGDSVAAVYTGWFVNGTKFTENFNANGDDLRVVLGHVIDGWVFGVPGMKIGGKRRLVIGSDMAYGQLGRGPIPPNTTLVFDVTVTALR